jgi:hypothetical protein
MITLVASAALALGASAAFAEPHGHGGGGVHFGGGHFGGPAFSFGFAAPYAYDYDSDYGCYAMRRVWTPFGWRWHRVYVCN